MGVEIVQEQLCRYVCDVCGKESQIEGQPGDREEGWAGLQLPHGSTLVGPNCSSRGVMLRWEPHPQTGAMTWRAYVMPESVEHVVIK